MYNTILLPVDLDEKSSWEKALPAAAELCRAHGAKLHIMTVVPDFGMSIVGSFFPEGFEKKAVEEATKALKELVATNAPSDIDIATAVCHGTVYDEVMTEAKRCGADLIVMAAHRTGAADYLLGPNAARVVRHSSCSVLVVRD